VVMVAIVISSLLLLAVFKRLSEPIKQSLKTLPKLGSGPLLTSLARTL
jgi:type II secretory pathway component PulJ